MVGVSVGTDVGAVDGRDDLDGLTVGGTVGSRDGFAVGDLVGLALGEHTPYGNVQQQEPIPKEMPPHVRIN